MSIILTIVPIFLTNWNYLTLAFILIGFTALIKSLIWR